MIGIKLQGQLGNQMFQYAFAYSLAKHFKTDFFIDTSLRKIFDVPKYFDLPEYNFWKNLFRWISSILFRKMKLLEVDPCTKPSFYQNKLKDNILYKGYFHSEEYFKNIQRELQNIFVVKEKHKKQFVLKYGKLYKDNKIIAVHIRRTDFLNWGGRSIALPVEYYKKCLAKINNIANCKILFASDDMDFCIKNFSHLKNAIFNADSVIIDFLKIQNADYCIIANSSLSWWAAYLNNKQGHKIYAPQYWLGFKEKQEVPVGVLVKNWELVEV